MSDESPILFTDSCCTKVADLIAEENNPELKLRVFVNGGGGTEFSPHAGTKQSGIGCDKSRWSLEEYFDFKYLSMIP